MKRIGGRRKRVTVYYIPARDQLIVSSKDELSDHDLATMADGLRRSSGGVTIFQHDIDFVVIR